MNYVNYLNKIENKFILQQFFRLVKTYEYILQFITLVNIKRNIRENEGGGVPAKKLNSLYFSSVSDERLRQFSHKNPQNFSPKSTT